VSIHPVNKSVWWKVRRPARTWLDHYYSPAGSGLPSLVFAGNCVRVPLTFELRGGNNVVDEFSQFAGCKLSLNHVAVGLLLNVGPDIFALL
jgi:hypothetical protein